MMPTLTYEDYEAHDDINSPADEEWADEISAEEPDTVIDIEALLAEIEEKHLPGQHDQQAHGGKFTTTSGVTIDDKQLRGDYKQILLSAYGRKPTTAEPEQIKGALGQLMRQMTPFVPAEERLKFRDFFREVFDEEYIRAGIERKHLAGRHDQQTHGGEDIWDKIEGVGPDQPGRFYTDIVRRHDKSEHWQELGLRMPTDDDLFNAYIVDVKDDDGKSLLNRITITPQRNDKDVLEIRITGRVQLEGSITSADDLVSFERIIKLNSDGEPLAYHAEFVMTDKYQGKGIGMDMLERSEALYESIGIKEIRLHANSTVGRYAWAKAGFDWHQMNRAAQVDKFYAWLQYNGVSTDDAPRSISHPWEIATWVHPTGKTKPFLFGMNNRISFTEPPKPEEPLTGKMYLLKSADSYDAVKRLDPNGVGYKIGKEYFKMRRQIRESLGYKSLVEKFGLKEAERRLEEFQGKNLIESPSQELVPVSPGMNDLIALLTRQNELVEQLMSRQAPNVTINNHLDPEPLAKAIRDSQPIIELKVEPVIDLHPTIEMPKVRTETSTASVLRDSEKKMTGAVIVHRTEYEETKDDSA